MTKKIITCPVGEPVIRETNWGSSIISYTRTRTVYVETHIDSLIDTLKRIKKDYPEFTDLRLNAVNDCGCYHDCSCPPSYQVYGDRLETDLEYDHRLKQENEKKMQQEEHDRKEYEKLKAKFGQV